MLKIWLSLIIASFALIAIHQSINNETQSTPQMLLESQQIPSATAAFALTVANATQKANQQDSILLTTHFIKP